MESSLSGLVLCGGRSSRMGSDKATLTFEGQRLVDRAAERLSRVAEPVMIAPGTPGRLGSVFGSEVADEAGMQGPLAGMVAGIRASPHELVAVVAVDMPWSSPDLFALLAEVWNGEDAVVPVDRAGPQVLHAVYATSILARLAGPETPAASGVRTALGRCSVRYVEEARWREVDPTGRFAVNLNHPDDPRLAAGVHLGTREGVTDES